MFLSVCISIHASFSGGSAVSHMSLTVKGGVAMIESVVKKGSCIDRY